MTATRRLSSFRFRPLYCLFGVSGLVLAASAPAAHAGDPRCAIYGPDFVAIEGTSTCVRIGGRVRVEAGNHLGVTPNSGWENDGMRPAGVRSDSGTPLPGDSMFTSHLRLHDGVATTDPFQH